MSLETHTFVMSNVAPFGKKKIPRLCKHYWQYTDSDSDSDDFKEKMWRRVRKDLGKDNRSAEEASALTL